MGMKMKKFVTLSFAMLVATTLFILQALALPAVAADDAIYSFNLLGPQTAKNAGNTDEIARARRVRFVLITGTNDFRRGNILDVFDGGFAREGFQAKLLDVPGMEHDICSGEILSAALDFIEGSP
jgi:hypothetical protein